MAREWLVNSMMQQDWRTPSVPFSCRGRKPKKRVSREIIKRLCMLSDLVAGNPRERELRAKEGRRNSCNSEKEAVRAVVESPGGSGTPYKERTRGHESAFVCHSQVGYAVV